MTPLKIKLKELNACREAIGWVGDRTIEEAVNDCHRGDWLLWVGQRIKIDHRKLTLAKGHCANTVRHLMKDKRSVNAVDAAITYGEGKIDKEELAAAADAAYAATAHPTYAAVTAYAAADAAAVAYAAAVNNITAYHDITAKQSNQKQTADICRQYIGQLIIDKFNTL
jgi:hypothetical protein